MKTIMDTYKLKFTRLQNEIFRLFCINAGKILNKREISLILKVSPTAVANSIVSLQKEELISVKKEKNFNLSYVSFNRDSQKAINFKKIENLKMLYDVGLPHFLFEEFPGSTIILFGSYSKGEDVFDSDIDIAIVGVKEKTLNLKKFEGFLKREINLNFYQSFKDIHKDLKNNLFNGIILSGRIDS